MTRTSENKAVVEELFERLSDQNLGVIDDLCADGFSVEISLLGTDESAIGIDGMKAMYEEYYAAFPDLRQDVVELVGEDDVVAVFLTTSGTHRGEFRGVPPTGNEIDVEDAGLIRFEDGQIVDLWPQSDMLSLFEQLGVGLDR
ncbi:MAG TPA: ester cyclase [Halobacteriales archaeon]|nr:ester cyclase [Halobacteriales archaeon]